MGAGRVAMTAIGLASVGIATRYLGPEPWGSFAAATAFVGVLQVLTDFGLFTIGAREIAKRPDEARQILSSLFTVGIAVSLGGAAIALGVMFLIYPGAEHHLVREAILLLMATVPLSAPYGAAGAYFIAQQQAYVPALTSLAASLVTVGLVAAAAEFDWGFEAVVLAYVIGAACQAVLLIALSAKRFPLRLSFDRTRGRQLFSWALPLGAAMLIGTIYWQLDLILLSLLKPGSEVALYGVSTKVLVGLVALPEFVMITLLPEFARLTATRERFDEIVQKAFTVLQVVALAIFVFVVGFATDIVRLLGGRAFEGAASVLQILMLAVALMYFGAVLSQGFVAQNKQKQLLLIGGVVLPLNLGLNLALIPAWGANGAAAAWVLSELVILAALAALYRRFARLPRLERAPQVLTATAAAAGVGLLKVVVLPGSAHALVVLMVGGVLTVAVYVLALYALRAMPSEVHQHLVLPVWSRLKPLFSSKVKT
jgi:O-antigen/teichoic acid export membrane protein